MSFYLKCVPCVPLARRGAQLLALSACLLTTASAWAEGDVQGPTRKDKGKGHDKPSAAVEEPSCRLLTEEAPRGGRLELETKQVGRTPLVFVNGEVVRILGRKNSLISAQIPRDSEGGIVTLKVEGEQLPCGTLSIIGKN